jgi:single-strand DNA-binding protein
MSQYLNEVHLIGYVGNDAQVSNTDGPTRISIATKRSWQNDQKQWQSRTEWHDVVAWNGAATIAAQLRKGNHVRIKGELHSREYEQDGVKRRTFEVIASEIHNLRPERKDETD